MNKPNRISLFFREQVCRWLGHRWQKATIYNEQDVRTGRICKRCGDAEAKHYRGQYPLPRVKGT